MYPGFTHHYYDTDLTKIMSASAALLGTAFAAPAKGGAVQKANKPAAAGPASASVTVYPSYTCTDSNTVSRKLSPRTFSHTDAFSTASSF